MENKQSRNIKVIILVCSVLTLFLLAIATVQENISVEWKDYQRAYCTELLAQTRTGGDRAAADINIKIRQLYLPQLNRTDRCITCHIGIDNPALEDADQPIRSHSVNYFEHHPISKFGCTVCHEGQGRATTSEEAHGEVEFWPSPLLRGKLVYTSCGRCHYDNDLYGADNDLFVPWKDPPPIMKDELKSSVAGGKNIASGKQLVLSSGCLGCHKYRGRGGTVGPDITYVGDKSEHGFDFTNIEGEHTVQQWLFEHFKNPDRLSPGTLMPAMDLNDQMARDLTMYMLSLHRKSMPASHTPVPPRRNGEMAGGDQLYSMFCNSCHGRDGQGSTVRDPVSETAADVPPELMVPSLNNPDTQAMASREYFEYIVKHGRPDTTMIPWGTKNGGGLRSDEIERIVSFMRTWDGPEPDVTAVSALRGNAKVGRIFYNRYCYACHGTKGEGGIGTTLNAPSFLAVASDEFLWRTLTEGRPNTAMPGWKQFDSQQISDLIAYMRGWHAQRNSKKDVLDMVVLAENGSPVSSEIGRTIYKANCVMCHGLSGEGDLATSISTQEFLTIVDNSYLYDTIVLGRPGTGMPAWRHLSSQDMASLIAYLRTWQKEKTRIPADIQLRGDWDTGEILYSRNCSGCHGGNAEGGVGPQLNNPVFLQTTTDVLLYEWVANGKTGTQMRAFIRGSQGMADLSHSQIKDIISFVRSFEWRSRVSVMRSPNGRPELGRLWYAVMCTSCHGDNGEGASGPSLSNKSFLHAASDGYLMATMSLGRDGTEMRPVKKSPQSILSLSSDEVNDLVAYLRSWEIFPPDFQIPHNFIIPWDLTRGKKLYVSNCSGCHGLNGKSEIYEPGLSAWAPSLNNEGFLAAATDGFIQATIVRGRTGTAMQAFGIGMQGLVDLSREELDDIVAYIRQCSTVASSPMTIPAQKTRVVIGNAEAKDNG